MNELLGPKLKLSTLYRTIGPQNTDRTTNFPFSVWENVGTWIYLKSLQQGNPKHLCRNFSGFELHDLVWSVDIPTNTSGVLLDMNCTKVLESLETKKLFVWFTLLFMHASERMQREKNGHCYLVQRTPGPLDQQEGQFCMLRIWIPKWAESTTDRLETSYNLVNKGCLPGITYDLRRKLNKTSAVVSAHSNFIWNHPMSLKDHFSYLPRNNVSQPNQVKQWNYLSFEFFKGASPARSYFQYAITAPTTAVDLTPATLALRCSKVV